MVAVYNLTGAPAPYSYMQLSVAVAIILGLYGTLAWGNEHAPGKEAIQRILLEQRHWTPRPLRVADRDCSEDAAIARGYDCGYKRAGTLGLKRYEPEIYRRLMAVREVVERRSSGALAPYAADGADQYAAVQ